MNDDTKGDAIGVDISKASLDVHRHSTGEAVRFANDAAGFEKLAEWIGVDGAKVVYESTGRWRRDFEEALAGRLPLALVNPLRARRFAQSMGEGAKTDKADARVLATMGAKMDLRLVEPRRGALRDLDELVAARDGVVKERTAARNRQKQARRRLVKRLTRNRLAQCDRQIKALDADIAEVIGSDAELSRRNEVLTSIPGVGPAVAAVLLAGMPELGRLDRKSAASLAGVAPQARDSGQWTGRRRIGGGRARPRRFLYMASVSAARCNPDMKRVHQGLVARGKPAKVALTAVMRKLVVLANVLLREDRLWTPEPRRPRDAAPAPAAPGEGSGSDRSGAPQAPGRAPRAPEDAPEDAGEDAGACARAPRADERSQPERLAEPPLDARDAPAKHQDGTDREEVPRRA